MLETVSVDSIICDESLYPRKGGFDPDTVARYRLALDYLPPISINQDSYLIDGYHRLMAHKIEQRGTIQAERENVPREMILWESARRNAAHGLQLSASDKRRLGRTFFGQGRAISEVAVVLSVAERTVRDWTEDLRRAADEERDHRILELWLACWTQERIGAEVGVGLATVNRTLANFQNGTSAKMEAPDSLQTFNLWNFHDNDERYGVQYPGRIPGQIVENVLYYYTEPFQTVVDPMAGGGTTIDVCKAMYRRYRAYDINPVRSDITKHDITQGFPVEAKGCDLIFMDPPYWSQKQGEYSGDASNLANLPLAEFYAAMARVFECATASLKPDGYLAVIIGPTQLSGIIHDHALAFAALLPACMHVVNRVIVPYTTQQAKGYHVADAKAGRYMLKLYRDLLICRRRSTPAGGAP